MYKCVYSINVQELCTLCLCKSVAYSVHSDKHCDSMNLHTIVGKM
jgi:hypothetical protein